MDTVRVQYCYRHVACHFWQTFRHVWAGEALQPWIPHLHSWLDTAFNNPNQGDAGAIELIVFRIVQGIGGAFLFANSAAIITDAFPSNERGKALGINQISFLAGSLIGSGSRGNSSDL